MKLIIAVCLLLAVTSAFRHRPAGRNTLFRQAGDKKGPSAEDKAFCADYEQFFTEEWEKKCEVTAEIWETEEGDLETYWNPKMVCENVVKETDEYGEYSEGDCTTKGGDVVECAWWPELEIPEETAPALLKHRLRQDQTTKPKLVGICESLEPTEKHVCDDDEEFGLYCFIPKVKAPKGPKPAPKEAPAALLRSRRH